MAEKVRSLSYSNFIHPKYWGPWIGLFLLWSAAHLPLFLQIGLGNVLGTIAYLVLIKRRRISAVNIQLCFPELNKKEQKHLARRCFRSAAVGTLEAASAWFTNPERFRKRTRIHGFDNLEAALRQGKGVILLGGHFSTLDLGGALYRLFAKADIMQRDHDNPVFNAVMTRSRQKLYDNVLNKDNLRGVLRSLRANHGIWYATDQDYGARGSVFAPFFGAPAATITTTARLAKKTGAAVVPFSHFRTQDGYYDIYFEPALDNYPSGDDLTDATATNLAIENAIKRYPEQYLWMHRRFKTDPEGESHNRYGGK